MQRIAFFTSVNQINFNHVGGLDSLARRLAIPLAESGDMIYYVHYGAAKSECVEEAPRVHQVYCKTFEEACEFLASHCDDVVSFYLMPKDRLTYARFRRSQGNNVRFHHYYSVWNESRLKRELLFAEARLFPFNGCLFSVSPRFDKLVSTWSNKSVLLLPAVSESFYRNIKDKNDDGVLRITYAGRIDPGKGTREAVDVMERLASRSDIKAKVSGYAWSHRRATLQMHEEIKENKNIIYETVEHTKWEPEVDAGIAQLLRETDVLLLPYQKLSSTMDMPLLLLEGMASLCAIITPQFGDLHDVYGADSPWNLIGPWETDKVVELILANRAHLNKERQCLMETVKSLQVDDITIANRFKKATLGC